MSLDAFLSQRARIVRPMKSGQDRYNASAYQDAPVANDIPCRQTTKQVRIVDPRTAEYAIVTMDLLLLPPGTDIQAQDKIYLDGGNIERIVRNPVPRRKRAGVVSHYAVELEALNA
jgi:hypothetical protein